MRVEGLDVDFELEAISGRLHRGLFIDGRSTESIDQRDGHKLFVDLDSQSVLVVTKRGAHQLVPLGSFAGLVVREAPKAVVASPAPAPDPSLQSSEVYAGVELDEGSDFTTAAPARELEDELPEETTAPKPKPPAKKPPLKRRR